MKIVMLSKALVAGVQQRKLEELAALPDVEQLTVIVPPYWDEPRVGRTLLDKKYVSGYDLLVRPMILNGHFHTHFYTGLDRLLRQLKPDLFHVDEESFNLATFQGVWLAQRHGIASVFYNWANIYRNYPPPFSLFEEYNFGHAGGALAGNAEAAAILAQRGFVKPVEICPQFGVDLAVTRRTDPPAGFARPDLFTIGYFGRLVEEKGLSTLIEACARLNGDWRLVLVGTGASQTDLQALAHRLNIANQVEFYPMVASTEVAARMSALDVFVLPSVTRPNWKEQFGRVLIEAMACRVPVIGSSSGEIPNVIGEAGLIFPEGNVRALAKTIQKLLDDTALRASFADKGYVWVESQFTQREIARKHLLLYKQVLSED